MSRAHVLWSFVAMTLLACQPAELRVRDESRAETENSLLVTPDANPYPGMQYQRQVLDFGRGPRVFHSIAADLSDPRIGVKVTRPDEFYATTSTFAQRSGAAVAINGDFFDIGATNQPTGLTVGDGVRWPGTEDSNGWRLFSCSTDKQCTIEPDDVFTPWTPTMAQTMGGHFIPTLTAGEVMSWEETDDCGAYCTGDHPRTAVGLSADGRTVFFIVGEGRIAGTHGPSPREVGLALRALGAWNALMLDGGGSSTLAVGGNRANRLPANGSAERVVANHLALMFDPQGGFGAMPALRTGAGPAGTVSLLAAFGRFTSHASPTRVLDTRESGALLGRRTVDLSGLLPADATALLANLTAVDAEGPGYLSAMPSGGPSGTSNVNYVPGRAVASSVRVGLSGRKLDLESSSVTHVVLDAVGHFGPAGAGFVAQAPARTFDSRAAVKLAPWEVRAIAVGGPGDATAVSLNLTVTEPEADGWLSVFPCDAGWPGTSSLNFVMSENRANAAVARLSGGAVCVLSNTATHVVVDVDGFYVPVGGHRFAPLAPTRVLDTRSGIGEWQYRVRARQVVPLELSRLPGLPTGTSAVSLGVIAVEPTRAGYLTVRPCDSSEVTSSLNFAAGEVVANQVTARLDAAGRVCVSSTADVHLVVDAFGVFAP